MSHAAAYRTSPWALAALVLVAGCGGSGPSGPQLPPVPSVAGVTPLVVSPGDTVTVTGSQFQAADQDRVRFNNALAVAIPFAATSTELSVVVPANAASGPVSVTVLKQPQAGVGPAITVQRGVGDVWVYQGGGSIGLPTPNASSEYVLIPHATNPGTPVSQLNGYTLSALAGAATAAAGTTATAQRSPRRHAVVGGNEAFEAHRWSETEELVQRVGVPLWHGRQPARTAAAADTIRSFYVLNTTTGSVLSASSYSKVTAKLRYVGTHCVIYSDVDTLATAGDNLSQSDIRGFGERWDQPGTGIHAIDTNYFGTESDVDGNGKVLVLISPVVNRLTPPGVGYFIGGFFNSVDLFTPGSVVPTGTSNHAEIFYLLAADPNHVLSHHDFSVAMVRDENTTTMAHEFEHLISFSQRIFHYSAKIQRTWLEEGMAHIAENLNGIDASNVRRVNSYLVDPGNFSLEDDNAPVQQRGGIFLFLRWLGDRFGDNIYKGIVLSNCIGRPCIEAVTGEGFYTTFGDFLATLYLSGRGITSDPKYAFQSVSMSDYNPLTVLSEPIDGSVSSGDVRRTAGDFYRFTGATGATTTFTITPASTEPRLRTVIVQTK